MKTLLNPNPEINSQLNKMFQARDIIAEPFIGKYGSKLTIESECFGVDHQGYPQTGFYVPNKLSVRMQIKDIPSNNEKKLIHFGRYIQGQNKDHQKYIILSTIKEMFESPATYFPKRVSSRGEYLGDDFKFPYEGIGVSLNYENPSEVANYFLRVNELVDEIENQGLPDPKTLWMAGKVTEFKVREWFLDSFPHSR